MQSCKPYEYRLSTEPQFEKKISADFIVLKKSNDTIFGDAKNRKNWLWDNKQIKIQGVNYNYDALILLCIDGQISKPINNKLFNALYFGPKLSVYKNVSKELGKKEMVTVITYALLKNNYEKQAFKYNVDGFAKAMSDKPEFAKKVKAIKKSWTKNQTNIGLMTIPVAAGLTSLAWGAISRFNNAKDTSKSNSLNNILIGTGATVGALGYAARYPFILKEKKMEQQIFAIMDDYNRSN